MAWEARWGLKRLKTMLSDVSSSGLNGVGGPLGIETKNLEYEPIEDVKSLNGVGGPLGIETIGMSNHPSTTMPV